MGAHDILLSDTPGPEVLVEWQVSRLATFCYIGQSYQLQLVVMEEVLALRTGSNFSQPCLIDIAVCICPGLFNVTQMPAPIFHSLKCSQQKAKPIK